MGVKSQVEVLMEDYNNHYAEYSKTLNGYRYNGVGNAIQIHTDWMRYCEYLVDKLDNLSSQEKEDDLFNFFYTLANYSVQSANHKIMDEVELIELRLKQK